MSRQGSESVNLDALATSGTDGLKDIKDESSLELDPRHPVYCCADQQHRASANADLMYPQETTWSEHMGKSHEVIVKVAERHRLQSGSTGVGNADFEGPDRLDVPTVAQLESFVGSLESRSFDLVGMVVELLNGANAKISIEGGENAATLTISDANFHHRLMDPDVSRDDRVFVSSGGVKLDRESNRVLPLEDVWAATRVFLETGRLDDAFCWFAEPAVIKGRR
jgi:hypothetical protein